MKEDRILHWLSKGAQPTDVVKNLMKKTGLAHKWHLLKMGLNDEEIEKSMQKWQLDKDFTLKLRSERAEEKAQLKQKEAEEAKRCLPKGTRKVLKSIKIDFSEDEEDIVPSKEDRAQWRKFQKEKTKAKRDRRKNLPNDFF